MKKKKLPKKARISGFLALLFLVVIIISIVPEYAGKAGGGAVTVEISKGSGTAAIAKTLQEHQVIKNPFLFRVISKLFDHDGTYLHGRFTLQENMGYSKIFTALKNGAASAEQIKVTLPEGVELRHIADILEEAGLVSREEFYRAVERGSYDYEFVKNLPKRENRLEGYLFPDTYLFTANDSAEVIVNTMLKRFDEIYTESYRARAKELGMTNDEIITLASVIEREAQGEEDRTHVAGVFHNRLKNEQYPYLESCATVQYILKERKTVLSVADTNINSPYNTYKNPGLPPGPIASPGRASIEAALWPKETKDLFFVLNSSGKHVFAETYEEHLANMKK